MKSYQKPSLVVIAHTTECAMLLSTSDSESRQPAMSKETLPFSEEEWEETGENIWHADSSHRYN